jgi:hypothetical protein
VIVPVADAASHVGRHDGSFGRQLDATHVAICVQLGSLGQLPFPQQLVATQVAHDWEEL